MLFDKALKAYKNDLIQLQDLERSKNELEFRIKEREQFLRSISRRVRETNDNSDVGGYLKGIESGISFYHNRVQSSNMAIMSNESNVKL